MSDHKELLNTLMDDVFSAEEVRQSVDDFIVGLTLKHALQGADSDLKEVAYVRLLMAANSAYRDGVTVELAGFVNIFACWYMEDGNLDSLPPEFTHAIENFRTALIQGQE